MKYGFAKEKKKRKRKKQWANGLTRDKVKKSYLREKKRKNLEVLFYPEFNRWECNIELLRSCLVQL